MQSWAEGVDFSHFSAFPPTPEARCTEPEADVQPSSMDLSYIHQGERALQQALSILQHPHCWQPEAVPVTAPTPCTPQTPHRGVGCSPDVGAVPGRTQGPQCPAPRCQGWAASFGPRRCWRCRWAGCRVSCLSGWRRCHAGTPASAAWR